MKQNSSKAVSNETVRFSVGNTANPTIGVPGPSTIESAKDGTAKNAQHGANTVLDSKVVQPSISEFNSVSEDHDVRVRDLLDQVIEYSQDHPGLIKNIRLRERTLGVLMPNNGDKVLDAFEEKDGSSQVQVLRKICDGNVIAIIGKESTIDFNIADSEQ